MVEKSMPSEKNPDQTALLDSARKKISDLSSVIGDNFFLGLPDVKFNRLPPAVAITIITTLTGGSQILFGNYGRGKTSLAEDISSLIFGVPLSVVQRAEAHGSDQAAPESYIAVPVMKDLDRIRWKPHVLLPARIFDEFNRLPERAQVHYLDGVGRGYYEYGGILLRTDKGPFFGTANWPDGGNNELIPPIKDRIDSAVVVTGVNPAQELGKGAREFNEEDIDDKEISDQMNRVLSDVTVGPGESVSEMYASLKEKMEELSSRFRVVLSNNLGLKVPKPNELAAVRKAMKEMPVSKDALGFRYFLNSEFTCPNCGEKTPEHTSCSETCHYFYEISSGSKSASDQGYAFSNLTTHVSSRVTDPTSGALHTYSAAYAWLMGDSVVEPKHIAAIMPYVLWHRVKFTERFTAANRPTTNGRNLELYLSEVLAAQILRRYEDAKPEVMNAIDALTKGDGKTLERLVRTHDHPSMWHAKNLYDALRV
jgi:hypothetical protein